MNLVHWFSMIIHGLLSFGGLWLDLMKVIRDVGGAGGDIFLERVLGYEIGYRLRGGGPVVWKSVEELPGNVEYDFIIVGGGTSGSVLASRLSSNPQYNILIIEAGPWHEDIFSARVPGLFLNLRKTSVDWNYTTTPQGGLNGRSLGYSRGRMMGGCSSFNNMAYTRGSKDDWDKWANVTGDEHLNWDNMFQTYMLKAEKLVDSSEKQSIKGHTDPTLHGHQGKLSVSAPYSDHPFNEMLIRATEELKDEFPFKLDMNDGRPIGIGWGQFTVDAHGERSSSATAYMGKTGRNVHVLVNTHVTRVLPINKNSTDFRRVEFAQTSQSERRIIAAKKEVILSGGVIGTPHILLNSGIGSRQELEESGIESLVDSLSVGKNLTDHPVVQVAFETTLPDTDYNLDTALAEWNETRRGPLALPNHLNHVIWVRLPANATPFSKDGFADPAGSMPNSPHIEMIPLQISSHRLPTTIDMPPVPEGLVTLQLLVSNLNPISRGSISLRTSDPFMYPNIDFKLLDEKVDIAIMREGIRSARRLYSAPVFKGSVEGTLLPGKDVTSDEDLDAYIRSVAATFTHGVGSAAMSPRGASWGVVDPDFRVKGTSGLRIIDASVLPSVPNGHTQAPVYGMAERGSVVVGNVNGCSTGTPTVPTSTSTPQPQPPPTSTLTTTPIPLPTTTTTTPPVTETTTTEPISTPPSSTSSESSLTISLPTTTVVPTTTSSTTSTTSTTFSESTTAIVSTSGGNIVTITSVTTASSRDIAPTGALPDGQTNNSHSSNGFFSNRGAVAGVFTVVGLIALAIVIALVTNAVRRRRAKKFDDEIAAAARDAANTQIPNFAAYADDDDVYRAGAYGSGATSGAKYSDASHGTYAQAPMAVPESYGMREMSPHGPNPGEYFDPGAMEASAAAGAAGIGVARARSMRDGGYAAGLTEGASPYAAFAAPGSNPAQSQYPHGMIRGAGGPEFDLERRPSQMTQQTDYSALSRNKSYNAAQSTVSPSYHSDHSYIPPSSDGSSAYSQGQQSGYPNSFNAFATTGQQRLQTIPAARSEEDLSVAYGGYISEPLETRATHSQSPPPGPLPNPFSTPVGLHDEYGGHSDDEEEPKRVLKVANE